MSEQTLIERVDEFMRTGQDPIVMPDSTDITYDGVPGSLIPAPLGMGVGSLDDDYYMELAERSNLMLGLQIEQSKLLKAKNSDIHKKILNLVNFSRGLLSKRPITIENVFDDQIDNLAGLNNLLYHMVNYSKHQLTRVGNYRKQSYVALHQYKNHLKTIEETLENNKLFVDEISAELQNNENSDDFLLMRAYADELIDMFNDRKQYKALVQDKVTYLANEIPMINELKSFTEKSTNEVEKIVLAIDHQVNSLTETKDAIYMHIKRGELMSVVKAQLDGLAKNTVNIYRNIGLSVQNINQIKEQMNPETVYGRSADAFLGYSKNLSESQKLSNNVLQNFSTRGG
ncbi:hypothetical protein HQ529_06270 [Candidatus Woesearchaeota archaeon]|nr:hypothetical protein [Candidatus Woesearchaeota archaeon]